ncbi:HTH domain-containing protein [Bacillus velezensis]
MTEGTKLTGAKRRDMLLLWLKEARFAINRRRIGQKANVSRQVIVQDISLLKAKSEPIIATSQGYLYISMNADGEKTPNGLSPVCTARSGRKKSLNSLSMKASP